MIALEPDAWSDLAVAMAGAAAALAGLLFVAVSINLREILALPRVPERAGLALILLVSPVFQTLVLLIPGQSGTATGIELLVLAAVTGLVLARLSRHRAGAQPRLNWLLVTVLPVVALVVGTALAGAGLVAGTTAFGALYWYPVAVVFALLGGLLNAWVLLVEILR